MSWGSKKQTKKGEMVNFKIPKETVNDVLKLPIADLSFRGINKRSLKSMVSVWLSVKKMVKLRQQFTFHIMIKVISYVDSKA